MRSIDHNTITDATIEQMSTTPDPRLKQIMESLVRHLHDWGREVDITPEEWLEGIKFLTAVGHKCDAYRQEFILLSDTLGFSSLVNTLYDKRSNEKGTQTSLLGPFYRQDSPAMELGASIVTKPSKGMEVVIYGRVVNAEGQGIPGASVEIWQPDETGNYDLQQHDPSEMDLRGHFHCDSEGRYLDAHGGAAGVHDSDGRPGRRHDPGAEAPRLPAGAHSFSGGRAGVSRARDGAVFIGR